MLSEIDAAVQAAAPAIVQLRHEFHQHPEIRYEEKWTSDRVSRYLDEIGVSHRRGLAKGTGILATIEGNGPRTVLLRGDMDALEIQEETGLPYASTIPGRMHACGHDGHTACLLGVARVLSECRHLLQGTVRLAFQPAEEEAAAGRFMVQDGAVDGADAAFALHGWPTLPVGKIGLREGYALAGADVFWITVHGRGCHAADPAAGVDPVLVAAHITTALQSLVSREIQPHDAGVVTVASIHAGTATNIIADTAVMAGTFRSFDPKVRETLAMGIQRIATTVAQAFRATAEVSLSENVYPPLQNDPGMTQFVRETAKEAISPDCVVEMEKPFMGAEDFAYYLQKVPGTFICLGVNSNHEGGYPPLHNSRYDFSDAAVPIAMKLMSSIAVKFLARQS
ncbi:MAG: N-acyl-L-amino acid amidohydrolase [Candidatus Hydrogenedentota bacterium]